MHTWYRRVAGGSQRMQKGPVLPGRDMERSATVEMSALHLKMARPGAIMSMHMLLCYIYIFIYLRYLFMIMPETLHIKY